MNQLRYDALPITMDTEKIRSLYERKVRTLSARPGFAREVTETVARVDASGACEIRSGEKLVRADIPAGDGGPGQSPTPGLLMRSGIISCLALGYRLWAARRGIPLGDVEVEMTCEIDARGQLAIGEGVPSRWQRIRYTVRLTSDAPAADLEALVAHADRVSPMLDALDKAIELERTLEIRRPASEP